MRVDLFSKARNKREKDQKYHYPVCPNCKQDYTKLSVCNQCNVLVCNNCKEQHWK